MAWPEPLASWLDTYPWLPELATILLIALLTMAIVRLNDRFFGHLCKRQERYRMPARSVRVLARTVDVLLVLIAFFVSLYVAGVTQAIWGALTALGVAGILIGFAAQDIAKNMMSGVVILFDQPFIPGDRIEVGGKEGVVETMRLRSTTLFTPDGVRLVVPNEEFIKGSVKNYSANPLRRIEVTVTVPGGTSPQAVEEALRDAASRTEGFDGEQPVAVRVQAVETEKLTLVGRVWVERGVHARALSDLRLHLAEVLSATGAQATVK